MSGPWELTGPELEREVVGALRELAHHAPHRQGQFYTRQICEEVFPFPVLDRTGATREFRRVASVLRALWLRGEVEQYQEMPGVWSLP